MDFDNTTQPIRRYAACWSGADNEFGPAVAANCEDMDFTLLFEQSILSILPSALMLLFAPLRVLVLQKRSIKTYKGWIGASKLIITAALAGLQLSLLVLWSRNKHAQTQVSVASAALSFLVALTMISTSWMEHRRSPRPSTLLNVYLLFSLIFDIAQTRTLFLRYSETPMAAVSAATVGVKLALLLLEAQEKRALLHESYKSYPPEATSGIFNRSFLWWLNSLFVRGFRRLLTFDDLSPVDDELRSEILGEKMGHVWSNYSRRKGRFTLAFAVARCLQYPLLMAAFPRLCLIGFNYAQPFLINRVIDFVGQPVTQHSNNQGYGLIGATIVIYLGIAILGVNYKHRLYRSIAMMRGGLVRVIYNHTLRLNGAVAEDSAAVTLMSTDIDRIESSMESLHECWAQFIEVALGIWLLARQLGWVCIVPLSVIIACSFGSGQVAKLIGGRQKVWAEAVQQRIATTSSMLGNMKSVKMTGLTNFMLSTVQGQRVRELDLQKGYRWMAVWMNVFGSIPESFASALTFVVFNAYASARGSESLSTGQAFTSLAIISLVTSPASQILAAVPNVASCLGSFERIQTYLSTTSESIPGNGSRGGAVNSPETGSDNASVIELTLREPNSKSLDQVAIRTENAYICPAPGVDPVLQNLDINIERGSISMIAGPVGSGKTTLLKAFLGEASCSSGTITILPISTAYCAQTPWLVNASIQQNICGLSHGAVDEEWYKTVLYATALDHDIRQLEDEDRTIIGSRGLTLSGGQKQRLALARALYGRRDILLLDDVLSALDARTEETVVSRLLGPRGVLRKVGCTVVLATNQTHHFHLADKVILLTAEGCLAAQGSYEELKTKKESLTDLIPEPTSAEVEAVPSPSKSKTAQDSEKEEAIKDLTRRTGDMEVYGYVMKVVGWRMSLIFCTLVVCYIFTLLFPQIWLKWWAEDHGGHKGRYISVYLLFSAVSITTNVTSIWYMLIKISPKLAIKMHYVLLQIVMRAPQSFFNTTDVGITLNRFSQDMTLITSTLATGALVTVTSLVQCLGNAALISTGSSYMALTIPFCIIGVYMLQKFYLLTSRQLRYLDLEMKSPLYSHFVETIDGLATIRAFGWQEEAKKTNIKHLDASQRPFYLLFCVQRWLQLVLDLIVAALAIIVVTLAIRLRSTTSGGLIGIALNNILTFTQSLSFLITHWAMLETSLGAVARLKNFEATTASEISSEEHTQLPEAWPDRGGIRFEKVTATYGFGKPALRDITFSVSPGQKIGICGRTGSGKSTLLSVLLRLLEIESGKITIDGIDLSTVRCDIVRERMICVPQDPLILHGSVRLNIDPTGLLPDGRVIEALSKTKLWTVVESRGGLDAPLNQGILSHGQQQLLCLARALLRKSSIVVLDEATSNVDAETDEIMQRIIREDLKTQTVICVAHRLNTILHSDNVLVLQEGRVVEFDSPQALLSNETSHFFSLAKSQNLNTRGLS